MKKLIAIAIAFLCCSVACLADDRPVPIDLTIGENLEVPVVPKKAKHAIKDHMQQLAVALRRYVSNVELMRDGEVVVCTMPCSSLFAPNSTELKESGKRLLSPFFDFMKYPTMYKLLVVVHSDNTGEEEYQYDLTDARAIVIDEYLTNATHESGENVAPYGLGCDDPVTDNASLSARERNRRVEIYIIPEWGLVERAKSGKL